MNEKQMTLAMDWAGQDPTGWIATEKLDGCRAYWDGRQFWTRGGNVIAAPAWFTAGLPDAHLDGEIWAGRGNLEAARRAVQYGQFIQQVGVQRIVFAVFDAPAVPADYRVRWQAARFAIAKAEDAANAIMVPLPGTVTSKAHLIKMRTSIQRHGGEGVVIRHPTARYITGRTATVLKVK